LRFLLQKKMAQKCIINQLCPSTERFVAHVIIIVNIYTPIQR